MHDRLLLTDESAVRMAPRAMSARRATLRRERALGVPLAHQTAQRELGQVCVLARLHTRAVTSARAHSQIAHVAHLVGVPGHGQRHGYRHAVVRREDLPQTAPSVHPQWCPRLRAAHRCVELLGQIGRGRAHERVVVQPVVQKKDAILEVVTLACSQPHR